MHSSPTGGHFGIRKTLAKVREIFCWPGSRTDVEKWCRNCTQCSVREGPTTRSRGKLKIYNVGAPFERMPAIHQWAGENLHFSKGEMVWLHNPQRKKGLSPKLQYQWEGPYKIIKSTPGYIGMSNSCQGGRKIKRGRRTKLRGVLQASCCLKRSNCCLPLTPVYFLEDSRRFYELLSPVLLLLSLTVLQLLKHCFTLVALMAIPSSGFTFCLVSSSDSLDIKFVNVFSLFGVESHAVLKTARTNKQMPNIAEYLSSTSRLSYTNEGRTLKNNINKLVKQARNYHQQDIFSRDFTLNELNSSIEKLDPKRSPGDDQIYGQMIKHFGDKAKYQLLRILNISWKTGKLLKNWKISIIVPILKPNKDAK
ncbi:hypothetical protein LAZ67_8001966 [Cordylochernes scorpioides]|uniref:Integrase zinc-binding domain-containing protein n=1 Tax=Cordylochernes scorpioides TaxID=51811 RepID=A0ABY6KQN4_9ARAC|nr:hypothetical protein LAZ67_8001966 [Cordylochernes scorpioides]